MFYSCLRTSVGGVLRTGPVADAFTRDDQRSLIANQESEHMFFVLVIFDPNQKREHRAEEP